MGGDTKPCVNISDAKKEILSKRRENPDITEGTLPAGTLCHGTGDDVTKGRHGEWSLLLDCGRTCCPFDLVATLDLRLL